MSVSWDRAPAMEDHRLVLPAVSAWVGAWVGTGFSAGHPLALALLACACILGLVCAGVLVVKSFQRSPLLPLPGRHALTPSVSLGAGIAVSSIALVFSLILGGAARANLAHSEAVEAAEQGRILTLIGRLDSDPAPRQGKGAHGEYAVFTALSIQGKQTHGSAPVKIFLRGDSWPQFYRFDVVRVRGVIDPSFPGALPYAGTMRTSSIRLLERPGGVLGVFRGVRSSLVGVCSRLDEQGRALVPGMAIGDDRQMSAELKNAFRATSLTHLTAVSGTHIAIVLGIVPLICWPSRHGRALVFASVLAVFLGLVGPSPSVLRAGATAGIGGLGSFLGRNGHGVASLGAVVIAFLFLNPWCGRDIGFALSVCATYGVLVPARALRFWGHHHLRADTRVGRVCQRFLDLVSVPWACSLMTAPILLLVNPQIATWSVAANLLAAPAVAPATIFGLAATIFAPLLPELALFFARLSGLATAWIAQTALVFSSLPGSRASANLLLVIAAILLIWATLALVRRYREG